MIQTLPNIQYHSYHMSHHPATSLADEARAALCGRTYPPELLARLDALPAAQLRADPWVALFQGRRLCRLHSRFAEAAALVEGALEALREAGDAEGEIWAMAEWVVLRYHHADYAGGLAGLDPLLARPMRPYLRAELQFGRFLCLTGLEQPVPAAEAGELALAELDREQEPWLQTSGRIQVLRNMAAAYHYLGQTRRSVAAAEQSMALAEAHPDAAHSRPWCAYELGLAYWRQGRLIQALETLEHARRLAEQWRHQVLWGWAVATRGHALRDQNRLDAALAAYQLANSWGEDPEGPAFIQLRQGRVAEARWSCEARLEVARLTNSTIGVADARLILALVEIKSGRVDVALGLLDQVVATYEAAGSGYALATARLYQAAAGLLAGRHDLARAGVAAYLAFARREQVTTCVWWIPELVEMLLLYAMREGIEPDWARQIIEQRIVPVRGLSAEAPPADEPTELLIARRLQASLLPEAPPLIPDLEIAAVVLPAAEIGGDFVGYVVDSGGAGGPRRLGLAVGDISGKGLAAALLLSGAVVALSSVASVQHAPAEVVAALHSAIEPYTRRTRMNIALSYVQLGQGPGGWWLRAMSAGGVPPLLLRADGAISWLDTSGFPIGTFAPGSYREVAAVLAPGDVLLLMSDGVIEMMDPRRALFGFDRLARTVAACGPGQPAESYLAAIRQALHAHAAGSPQHDDLTIMAVRSLAGAVG